MYKIQNLLYLSQTRIYLWKLLFFEKKKGYSEVHVMHIPQAFTYTVNYTHRTNKKQQGIVLHPHMWKY